MKASMKKNRIGMDSERCGNRCIWCVKTVPNDRRVAAENPPAVPGSEVSAVVLAVVMLPLHQRRELVDRDHYHLRCRCCCCC